MPRVVRALEFWRLVCPILIVASTLSVGFPRCWAVTRTVVPYGPPLLAIQVRGGGSVPGGVMWQGAAT